jgi:hypothetical protein
MSKLITYTCSSFYVEYCRLKKKIRLGQSAITGGNETFKMASKMDDI